MRLRLAVLVAVTSVLTVLSPALAGPVAATNSPTASMVEDWAYVQRLLFDVPMRQFLATAASPTVVDRRFDWSTDYCSAPLSGNSGFSFDFRAPCRRHDFGYRNLHLLDRRYGGGFWTSTNRRRVDQRFLADMNAHCATRAMWLQWRCYSWARTYYVAVRLLGGP